ncbi:MAG: TSUP family transporter, partial [Actinomycetota bacterium]
MIQLLGAGISGVGVGTSLGLLGGGGSILTVPILVYLLSVPVPQAVVISLVVVLAASFAGATAYVRAGEVPMVRIASFAAAGAVGTVVGAYINKSLSESTVLMAFA